MMNTEKPMILAITVMTERITIQNQWAKTQAVISLTADNGSFLL